MSEEKWKEEAEKIRFEYGIWITGFMRTHQITVENLQDAYNAGYLQACQKRQEEIDYKGVKFFCKSCGKEIWQSIEKDVNYTLPELDRDCICSDCILKEVK